MRLSIGSCEHLPCYMPSRERVRINAEFECIGKIIGQSNIVCLRVVSVPDMASGNHNI